MNLLHLQYFYVVAKEGGFTAASKALRIQQPAISRMVKQLEDSMGFPLFERVGRQVRLTPQGKEVFAYSRKIFAEVDQLQVAVGKIHGEPQGPLVFGASEPIASHFVPEILAPLLAKYPSLYPNIFSGPAALLLERIKSGELEFGLFFHLPELPEGLSLKVVRKVRFHLVIGWEHRNKKAVLESFIGSREIDDVGTRTFPTLAKLKKIHPKAAIKISSNNLTAHRSLVLKGLGVAVLPDFLVAEDLKAKRLADVLMQDKLEFDLKLVTRTVSVPNLNVQSFLTELEN